MPRKPPARVVVITGASNGPGRAIALEFALHNDALVLASRRETALDSVRRDCEALRALTLAHVMDLGDSNAAYTLANIALERFKRIDIWINYAPPVPMQRGDVMPPEALRDPASFDLSGYVNGAAAAMAVFKSQGHGVLINVDALTGGAPEGCDAEYAEVRRREQEAFAEIERSARETPGVQVMSVMPPRTPVAAETLAPMIVSLASAQSLGGVVGRVRGFVERGRFRLWSRVVPPHRHGARPEVPVDRSRAAMESDSGSARGTAVGGSSSRGGAVRGGAVRGGAVRAGAVRAGAVHGAAVRRRARADGDERHGSWHLSTTAPSRELAGTLAVLIGIPAMVLAAALLLVR